MVFSQGMALFPEPGTDLTESATADYKTIVLQEKKDLRRRWEDERGREIRIALTNNAFDRSVLDRVVGKVYGKYDLRGIDLSERTLAGLDLSGCDLFAANLAGADLSRADLTGALLSEADIRGTRFDWCVMKNAYLDNATFDAGTSFHGVDLDRINFTLAALLREAAISQQVIHDLESRHAVLAWVLRVTSDYGRSFSRFALWCLGIVLSFALLYWLVPNTVNGTSSGDFLYFSVITFTTLGFGDLAPVSALGRLLVVLEVILGYFMMGLLIAILARKVLR